VLVTRRGSDRGHRARPQPTARAHRSFAARSGAVLLTALLAAAPVALSVGASPAGSAALASVHDVVPAHLPVTHKQVPPTVNPFAAQQALVRLDDRLKAVEAATVTLVGHPIVPAGPEPDPEPPVRQARLVRAGSAPRVDAVSRTVGLLDRVTDGREPAGGGPGATSGRSWQDEVSRPDGNAEPDEPAVLDGPAVPGDPTAAPEQLPPRIDDARQQIAVGDLSTAIRAVDDVEQDVLLVATDLADGSAQSAALARQLVLADPLVAALDAAVAATHAAADGRDVVAAATAAIQARDAAAGVTAAAQVAAQSADEALKAALARAELQSHSTDGFANGNIPLEVLCPVEFAPRHHLRCDAAEALARMNVAYRAAFGHDIAITDSYRTLEAQVRLKAAKGSLAATPGTSNHGWGLAIDLGDGANSYRSPQYAWLKANAVLYGWHHPSYMDEGGRGPHEPWHWEFGTVDDRGSGTSAPILVSGEPNTATPAVPVAPVEQPGVTPTPTPTPSPTPTRTPRPTPSPTPTGTPTGTPTPTPGGSPTPTTTPSPDPTPSATPTDEPAATPTEPPADTPPADTPTDPVPTDTQTPEPDPAEPTGATPTDAAADGA